MYEAFEQCYCEMQVMPHSYSFFFSFHRYEVFFSKQFRCLVKVKTQWTNQANSIQQSDCNANFRSAHIHLVNNLVIKRMQCHHLSLTEWNQFLFLLNLMESDRDDQFSIDLGIQVRNDFDFNIQTNQKKFNSTWFPSI